MQQEKFIEYYNEYYDGVDDDGECKPLLYFDTYLLKGNKDREIKYQAYRKRLDFITRYGDHYTVLVIKFGLFKFRPVFYIRLFKSFTLTEEDVENYIRIRDARRSRRTSLRS